MSVRETPLSQIDVSDPRLYRDDIWQPMFARLRAEDPVHYCAASRYGPYWSVTRYDDIAAVEIDHATFSSAAELGGTTIAETPHSGQLSSFIRMDPPRHTAQRKTVAPVAAPTNLAHYETTIRDRTRGVLDGLPRNEAFDWVDRVSIELTTMMLATLFDFPFAERRKLTDWSDVATADLADPDAVEHEGRMTTLRAMGQEMALLWAERAKAPPKLDLISMMAHAPATQNMTAEEFVGTFRLLIVAGSDTTRNTMTGGLLALHENPAEWAKLRGNPSLVPSLVAETIRYTTPIIHMRRTARTDIAFREKRIRQGDKVVMWYVSGNRDDAVILDPDRFIVDRAKPRQHLAFGAGIHRCVGDRLADLQLRILWEEILARDLRVEVLEPPQRICSNFVRGFSSMRVRVTR